MQLESNLLRFQVKFEECSNQKTIAENWWLYVLEYNFMYIIVKIILFYGLYGVMHI